MVTYRIDEKALNRGEMMQATRVGGRAFFNDPFFSFLIPNDKDRRRSLPIFFRSVFAHMGPKGRVVTVRNEEDIIVGVAAWQMTGGYPLSVGTQLAQLPSSLRAMYRRPKAMGIGYSYMAAITGAHKKDAHWYLMVLCADPSVQRTGVGTLLLEQAFTEIDAEGVGTYLETPRDDNIAYYRRFGFELVDTLQPVEGGAAYYTMWRPPR
jgi:ribosomal protein S18 acetylase RimI-like enzyme